MCVCVHTVCVQDIVSKVFTALSGHDGIGFPDEDFPSAKVLQQTYLAADRIRRKLNQDMETRSQAAPDPLPQQQQVHSAPPSARLPPLPSPSFQKPLGFDSTDPTALRFPTPILAEDAKGVCMVSCLIMPVIFPCIWFCKFACFQPF